MSKTGNRPCFTRSTSKTQIPVNLKGFWCLLIVTLLVTLLPARAEEPEDQYLRIYGLVQQADALNTSGQPGPALAKYREAHKALLSFQRENPQWNKKVVSFRLNDVAEKVAALSEKAPTLAGGGTGTNLTSTPQVKLLEAGAEPRKVLRLHPKPGDKQTLGMTLKMAMEMKMGETETPAMKIPAMKMTVDMTVKSVSPDGDITYEMVLSDASVADDPDVMPQVAEAMKSAFANVKGTSGTGTKSNRGFSKGTEMKAPADATPQVRQAMDQMKEAFSNLAAPLPEEAVGPGAKWEVKMLLQSQGMMIEQTAIYQLVSIEGERLTAKSTISQSASNQKIENPAIPGGMKLDLTKMAGNGTGEVTFDLAKLLPPEATMHLHSEVSMGMDMGGQKQPMNMKTELNMRLEAK